MNLRERFIRYFKGEKGINPPFLQCFNPMSQTIERWLSEGMKTPDEWFYKV